MTVKRINTELVRATLKRLKLATKPEVAKATGLSVMTCGTILNELLATGEVLEQQVDPSSGGRPAIRYEYQANYAQIVCLYARTEGNEHFISYQVCNLLGECLEENTIYYDEITYDVYEQQLERLKDVYPAIKVAGIGVQGVVHEGVIGVCDIKRLEKVDIVSKLEDKLKIDIVAQNDMNLITYGYYQKQEDESPKNIAYVYFPDGNYMGAGLIVNGQVVKGETNFSGELSFLPLGILRSEQLEQFKQPDTMVKLAAKSIASLIAIINPAVIVLAGRCVKEEDLKRIESEVKTMIPGVHMPTLKYRHDIHADYMNGLKTLTLEQLSYPFKFEKKTF